jgi:hypothetical protein
MSLLTDLQGLLTGFDALNKNRALNNVAAGMQEAFNAFSELKGLDLIEKRFESLQKTFGLSIQQAAEMGEEIDSLAQSFGIGGEAMLALQSNLKPLIGIFASKKGFAKATDSVGLFEKSLINSTKYLTMNFKLSGAVANKYAELYSGATGGLENQLASHVSISSIIENTLPGIEITQDLLSDMAGLTSDIQLQYGKMPGSLELAVIKAKQLGINMAQLNATGQNLLNIESSIGQEMEYQLLSGRRLVDEVSGESLTNSYRAATIQGDANKQAEIMNKLLKQEGKTLKNNLFARQQMAGLLQTDEATIAKMLKKQDILEKLDPTGKLMGLSGEELRTKLAAMGASATDIAGVMAGEDLRSTDEKLNVMLDQMMTTGIRAMIVDDLGSTYGNLATSGSNARLGVASKAAAVISGSRPNASAGLFTAGGQIAAELTTALGSALSGGALSLALGGKAVAKTNPIPTLVVATDDTDDFLSGPGGGRMLLGPEGALSLNKNDFVFGGTKPFGDSTNSGGSSSNGDIMQFAAAVVAAITNQTRELKSDPLFGRGLTNSYYG